MINARCRSEEKTPSSGRRGVERKEQALGGRLRSGQKEAIVDTGPACTLYVTQTFVMSTPKREGGYKYLQASPQRPLYGSERPRMGWPRVESTELRRRILGALIRVESIGVFSNGGG